MVGLSILFTNQQMLNPPPPSTPQIYIYSSAGNTVSVNLHLCLKATVYHCKRWYLVVSLSDLGLQAVTRLLGISQQH